MAILGATASGKMSPVYVISWFYDVDSRISK
jgi:hypothetical protein